MELDRQQLIDLIDGIYDGDVDASNLDKEKMVKVIMYDSLEQGKKVATIESEVSDLKEDLSNVENELVSIRETYAESTKKRADAIEKGLWIVAGTLIPIIITLVFKA